MPLRNQGCFAEERSAGNPHALICEGEGASAPPTRLKTRGKNCGSLEKNMKAIILSRLTWFVTACVLPLGFSFANELHSVGNILSAIEEVAQGVQYPSGDDFKAGREPTMRPFSEVF